MHRILGNVLFHVWLLVYELDGAIRIYNSGRREFIPILPYRPWDNM